MVQQRYFDSERKSHTFLLHERSFVKQSGCKSAEIIVTKCYTIH